MAVSSNQSTMPKQVQGFAQTAGVFTIVALIGFVMHQILFKGHIFSAPPIYNDDFLCYSSDWNHFYLTPARPIVFAVIWLIGLFGPTFVHASTCLMTVTYFAMVFLFISKWLELPKIPLPLLLFATIGIMSYEHILQCYHYTCTFAGPLTGIFSLGAIFLIYDGFGKENGWLPKYCLALLLSAAALLTREDFLLPLMMFCFYFSFIEKTETLPFARKRARIALISFVVVAAAIFIQQRFLAGSPFISGSVGSYALNFNPTHMLSLFWQYLACTTGSKIAFSVQMLSLVIGLFFQKRVAKIKWLYLQAMIFALIFPYLLLSSHFFPFYPLNWLPWQFASSFILVFVFANQTIFNVIAWALLAISAPLMIWQTQPDRNSLTIWFNIKDDISKHVLETLSANRERINHYKTIAVTGAPSLGPWTFTNGDFLKYRMHLNCRWLMFADPNDDFYKTNHLFAYPRAYTIIELHPLNEMAAYSNLPVLKLAPDGTGIFVEPTLK